MPELITHQPRPSEDRDLDAPAPTPPKSRYYEYDPEADLLQRFAFSLDYPETRALYTDAAVIKAVCPDEFVGSDCVPGSIGQGTPIPNDTMPEACRPESIIGGEFKNTGNAFDIFLEKLRQLCRNYNFDLYRVRQELFRVKFSDAAPDDLRQNAGYFRRSAEELSKHLALHDSRLPKNNGVFVDLAVEFVKVNGYIASIRAGCSEPSDLGADDEEAQYSSSSHISISSMFSSYSSP